MRRSVLSKYSRWDRFLIMILSIWKCNLFDVLFRRHKDDFRLILTEKMSLSFRRRRPKCVALLSDLLVTFDRKLCDFFVENCTISSPRIARFFLRKWSEFLIENFVIFSSKIFRFLLWKWCDVFIENGAMFSLRIVWFLHRKLTDFFIEISPISSSKISRFFHRKLSDFSSRILRIFHRKLSDWKFCFFEKCALSPSKILRLLHEKFCNFFIENCAVYRTFSLKLFGLLLRNVWGFSTFKESKNFCSLRLRLS